jgi:hypothetical protein
MDRDRGGVAMESLTDQRESSHPPAAVAGADSTGCHRLVLLLRYGKRTDDISVVADDKTTSVASCTSTGRRFRVSFGLAQSRRRQGSPAFAMVGSTRMPTTAMVSVP